MSPHSWRSEPIEKQWVRIAVRWLGFLVGVAVMVPAGASAGTAAVQSGDPLRGDQVLYTAARGERNSLTVEFRGFDQGFPPGTVVFTDAAGVSAGRGCVAVAGTSARCRFNDSVVTRVLLGDGDDAARVAGNDQGVDLDGGPGDDSLRGGRGNDAIDFGSPPTDTLVGGLGNDVLRGASAGVTKMLADSGPDGRDVFIGGKGADTVSYAARRQPLEIRFDAAPNDGAAGEGDIIGTKIDNVVGGAGEDRLIGNAKRQGLNGGPGRDVVKGGFGDDVLRAGRGADADELSGGSGADLLDGNAGPNVLTGGPGFDRLHGRGGNDVLRARDGGPDALFCDKGRDRAGIDGLDFIPRGCERHIRRRGAAAVLIQRESESDNTSTTAGFKIGCPIDGPRRCEGLLYLRERPRGRQKRHRFSVARGRIGIERFEIIEGRVGLKLVTRNRRSRLVIRRARGIVTAGPVR